MILLRTSIFLLLLFLLPDWYIYKIYLKNNKNQTIRRLHWVPSIALIFSLIVFLFVKDSVYTIFGIYLVVALCLSIPKLIFMVFTLITRLISRQTGWYLPHKTIATIPSVTIMVYIFFGAVWGKEFFQVKEITFTSAEIPKVFDGYKILQLSDIHSGSWTGNGKALAKAIEICNKQKADLALFTGDMVNSRADELLEFMPILCKLKANDGIYSILGNHDYGTYTKWASETERLANIDSLIARQNRMGWRILLNENRIIKRENDSIAIVGVENSGNPPFPDLGDLPKATKGTDGMFKILMTHDPTHWRRDVLPNTDIQLTLSGHTHDMQISIGGFSFSQLIYPEHNGMYMNGQRGLYVNIGLGFVLFPMRLGAWPEITIITLKKEL